MQGLPTVASRLAVAVALILAWIGPAARQTQAAADPLHAAVVKLYVTVQRYDYLSPWRTTRPGNATGTGFLIGGRRILTNAHIVSDTRFVLVQKDGDPRRHEARVTFAGHDCDLATLTVDDPEFFEGMVPMELADTLPALNDPVTVLGYPLGGSRLSVTRGVVSRIDYNTYAHSGADQHLVLQVDAAINPGNSGGPILDGGRVVGLAFQGLSLAENIGYAIPLPVIRHFLDDIEDGVYHGYPELGVGFMETRNPAMRAQLRMADGSTGVAVYRVDPFGSAAALIRNGDVLTSIDGFPIANDGTIRLDGDVVIFSEILERKQWGDSVALGVWRDQRATVIDIPLRNPFDPFVYRFVYDERPRYFVHAGLVFTPLSQGFLRSARRREDDDPAVQRLDYYAQYAKIDGLHEGREEFVVLGNRLPHAVNTYADGFVNCLVDSVNGLPVRCLADVRTGFARPGGGFHVVRFAGMEDSLVLDAVEAARAGPAILAAYGVPDAEYFGSAGAPPPSGRREQR